MIDPDQMDHVDRKVMGDIAEHGWCDISVFPTESSPGVYFNYTVGLVELSHPDLLMMGLANNQMHGVLCSAVATIEKGTRFNPNQYYDEVLQNYQVAFVEVDDINDERFPMSMAKRLYGHVQGLQLVWPDEAGRFPWHDDYDSRLRERQPLAGTWRGSL